jgi:soluble lytic murein transglycosylase
MVWNRKSQRRLVLIVLLGVVALTFERCQDIREHSQDKNIVAAARKYGIDPALVKAVVWRESRFNPRVRGTVGEIGLMQVGKAAAEEWAQAEHMGFFQHGDLYDPAKNTMAGTWYLRKMLHRYMNTDNPVTYALADYNAGRGNVLRWNKGVAATNSLVFLKQMDFPQTRDYVRAILKRQPRYEKEFVAKGKSA